MSCRYCANARRPPRASFLFQFIENPRQAVEKCKALEVLFQRPRRGAPYGLTGAYDFGRKDAAAGAEHGARLDACLIADSHLTADHGIVADLDASGESGLRSDHDVAADAAVMADMDHVVELG